MADTWCLVSSIVCLPTRLQELLTHSSHRQELLQCIWKAFLSISESAMQVCFKSDYLALAGTASTAMGELLFTKEALAEARLDNNALTRDVSSLSAAHAEESGLRRALRLQCEELQTALAREQSAHQHAVQKYVEAVEKRYAGLCQAAG
eukprot:jgi/Chrzof1/4983/Cz15g07120.t1